MASQRECSQGVQPDSSQPKNCFPVVAGWTCRELHPPDPWEEAGCTICCTQQGSTGTGNSMKGTPRMLLLMLEMNRISRARCKEEKNKGKIETGTCRKNLQAPCLHKSSTSPAILRWLTHWNGSGSVWNPIWKPTDRSLWLFMYSTFLRKREKSALNHFKLSS